MTRWTHEEVGDLYRRAERAEDTLLAMLWQQYGKPFWMSNPENKAAIEVLQQCSRVAIKEELAKMLPPPKPSPDFDTLKKHLQAIQNAAHYCDSVSCTHTQLMDLIKVIKDGPGV